MKPDDTVDDWTLGGDKIVYQHCLACGLSFYFRRPFCPSCGATPPAPRVAAGTGVVHASTLVLRAASDAFRAIAPYRIVLVDLTEGIRVMAHGDPSLRIGDAVRGEVREIAGRPMPYFSKESHAD
jgi:uncharacterized protein